MKRFGGLFEFEILAVSPKGKTRPITEAEVEEYCYDAELSDAIEAHVDKFLEAEGASDFSFQVETYENNGGPLIDYCITVDGDDDRSPMWDLSLEGVSIPHRTKKGWRIGVSAGGVRSEAQPDAEDVDGDEDDEDDEETAEFLSLYSTVAQILRKKPGVTVHRDSVTGRSVGVAENGDAFVVDLTDRGLQAVPAGMWDAEKKTIIQAKEPLSEDEDDEDDEEDEEEEGDEDDEEVEAPAAPAPKVTKEEAPLPADYSTQALVNAEAKKELYPPVARVLEEKPGWKAHVDSSNGYTVGVTENGDVFWAWRDGKFLRLIREGVWDKEKKTTIRSKGA